MEVKFSPPDITEAEINEVVDTLRSGWITTGPKTKRFEREIAGYCGTPGAVCLNSATAGLELILRYLGVGPGDQVITSAYTYTASASVIEHVGAEIVLCDVGKNSFFVDFDQLDKLITDRTKAIITVDIGGKLSDYTRLFRLAESRRSCFRPSNPVQEALGRIAIIGDCAHSFGARAGKMSGNFADFSSFSFHAVKNLTTAEGGAVTWRSDLPLSSEEIYRTLTLDSLHGQNKDALTKNRCGGWEYDIVQLGYKCNMTDIMASIGLAQLKRYERMLNRRHEIIARYDAALTGDGRATSMRHIEADARSSGHLYLLRLNGKSEDDRNAVIGQMAGRGIACNVHYKPLSMFTAYRRLGFDISDFPNAYEMYRNEITLPLHTCLTEEQVSYVIDSMKSILAG